MAFTLADKKIFVAGHRGMVGSAIERRLETENCEILTADRSELDLMDQAATRDWIGKNKPDIAVIAAAKVGGILANDSLPAEFLYNNLTIAGNVIEACHRADVDRLLFLGSSCIYPKFADQPIEESSLLTGPLEPTNEWYAIAKIAGIKLCQAYQKQYGRSYISAMPTNLYGPGDNFDLETSHVMPALIRKAHEAKMTKADHIEIWGSGNPRREFLHADDCADACIFLLKQYAGYDHVNVGSGEDVTILELVKKICDIVGFDGTIKHDLSKPDGTPRKLMSSEKLNALGWKPKIALDHGIRSAYEHYLSESD